MPPGVGELVGQDVGQPVRLHPLGQDDDRPRRPQQQGGRGVGTHQQRRPPRRVQPGQGLQGRRLRRAGRGPHQPGEPPVAVYRLAQAEGRPRRPDGKPQPRGGQQRPPSGRRGCLGGGLRPGRRLRPGGRRGRAAGLEAAPLPGRLRCPGFGDGLRRRGLGRLPAGQGDGHPYGQAQPGQHQQPQAVIDPPAGDERPQQGEQHSQGGAQQAHQQQGFQKFRHVIRLPSRPAPPAGPAAGRCPPGPAPPPPPGRPPCPGRSRRTACR